jgi:hypothetical protein
MKVLIACEYSGITREAFKRLGHDVWSCDILPTEQPGQHIVDDVRNVLDFGWDLMIAHPPCTYTSAAGYRWFKIDPDRMRKARAGYEFFMQMVNAPIPKIAVENTRGLLWQWYRKPDCVVHPYYFGDPFTKATCFWLKGLPPLHSTNTVAIKYQNWTKYYGSHTGHDRSRTFTGIAEAMAQQWGGNKMQPVQAEMFASGAA